MRDRWRPRPPVNTFRVALPVEVKVHPGGHVEYVVDTSRASTAVAEEYGESPDLAIIEADHERRRALEAAVPAGFEILGSDRGQVWILRHEPCGRYVGRPHIVPNGPWVAYGAASHTCPEVAR